MINDEHIHEILGGQFIDPCLARDSKKVFGFGRKWWTAQAELLQEWVGHHMTRAKKTQAEASCGLACFQTRGRTLVSSHKIREECERSFELPSGYLT